MFLCFFQVKTAQGESAFEKFATSCQEGPSRAVLIFLLEADVACDLYELCNADCLLELFFLGVHPDYWNKKIGEGLTKATVEVAKKLSLGENVKVPLDNTELSLEPIPKLVAAVFTSPKSQRVGEKCEFEVAARVWYKDHYYNGKSYASVLEEGNTNAALAFKLV